MMTLSTLDSHLERARKSAQALMALTAPFGVDRARALEQFCAGFPSLDGAPSDPAALSTWRLHTHGASHAAATVALAVSGDVDDFDVVDVAAALTEADRFAFRHWVQSPVFVFEAPDLDSPVGRTTAQIVRAREAWKLGHREEAAVLLSDAFAPVPAALTGFLARLSGRPGAVSARALLTLDVQQRSGLAEWCADPFLLE